MIWSDLFFGLPAMVERRRGDEDTRNVSSLLRFWDAFLSCRDRGMFGKERQDDRNV